jgi:predicted RNase H-like nuclease
VDPRRADRDPALLFVDAPLVVDNRTGQRACETQIGQRYGRWNVSANSTNLASPRLAGVTLRTRLQTSGWRYHDGRTGPPVTGQVMSECYPHTTLVGASELGYDHERPSYKRKPAALTMTAWRPLRAATCDDLIDRMTALHRADPPLLLLSHPATHQLVTEKPRWPTRRTNTAKTSSTPSSAHGPPRYGTDTA